MKPLRQGELDALCGIYATVNALRFCSGRRIGLGQAQGLFRHIVQSMEGEMARITCSGSTDADVRHYVRLACAYVLQRHGVSLSFRRRVFSTYTTMEAAMADYLATPNRVVMISVDRHVTVVTSVNGPLWGLLDSWGYAYLHCTEGKVARQKPLLRAMPEGEEVIFVGYN